MKEQLLLVALTLATASNLSGMNVEKEIADMKISVDLLATLAQDNVAGMTTDNERYAGIVRDIQGLTQNIQAQHEEIGVLRNTIQGLAGRVKQLEQQPRAKPESRAQKIFSHPLTWVGLIAVCILASIVHGRWYNKEKDIENETTTIVIDPVE